MNSLYIGIMSGTSANAVDTVLVDFAEQQPIILANHTETIGTSLQQAIHAFAIPGHDELNRLAEVDIAIAQLSAHAVNQLLKKAQKKPHEIKAIGSHGQTIRHQPTGYTRYTFQVGDGNIITTMTGITTVTDFRRRDIALGGQGAPLTPIFHQHFFATSDSSRIVLNLGGIANISILPNKTQPALLGFDTGPGNTLLDQWIQRHCDQSYDDQGRWGREGRLHPGLLKNLLSDPYFSRQHPKSTGLEYFNLKWLYHYLESFSYVKPIDVQATLIELTAISVIQAVQMYYSEGEIIVCGGGAYNDFLIERIRANSTRHILHSSKVYGIDPEWIESVAFAWLAKLAIHREPGNVPSVTGARSSAVLGAIYQP